MYSMKSVGKDHVFMTFIPWKHDSLWVRASGADASLRNLSEKVVGSIPFAAFSIALFFSVW